MICMYLLYLKTCSALLLIWILFVFMSVCGFFCGLCVSVCVLYGFSVYDCVCGGIWSVRRALHRDYSCWVSDYQVSPTLESTPTHHNNHPRNIPTPIHTYTKYIFIYDIHKRVCVCVWVYAKQNLKFVVCRPNLTLLYIHTLIHLHTQIKYTNHMIRNKYTKDQNLY